MRRKRLQHVADTLCHMFCGWRLIGSKPLLVRLGTGEIAIDAVTGGASHDGRPLQGFAIAEELRAWLLAELNAHRIPLDEISEASLAVKVELSVVPWRDTGEEFLQKGETTVTDSMHRCHMACASTVRTTDAVYTSEYSDLEHWPVGWPS